MSETEREWTGPPGLEALLVPIGDLEPHPDNPRVGDVATIATSLRVHGQYRPIVSMQDGRILAGNHTFKAAKELGWTHIAVIRNDYSEEQARQVLVGDNRSSDLGSYDDALLSTLLQELMDGGQLEGTGFDADGVEDMLAQLGEIAETDAEEFTGGYIETSEATAERWNATGKDGEEDGRGPLTPMKEVVLMLKEDEFTEFAKGITALKAAYGTDSTIATVVRAIREAAAALPQETAA